MMMLSHLVLLGIAQLDKKYLFICRQSALNPRYFYIAIIRVFNLLLGRHMLYRPPHHKILTVQSKEMIPRSYYKGKR